MVLTISCTTPRISGVDMYLSHTGFSASTKLLRSISEAWRYLPLIIAGALIASFSIDRLLRRMPPPEDEE